MEWVIIISWRKEIIEKYELEDLKLLQKFFWLISCNDY